MILRSKHRMPDVKRVSIPEQIQCHLKKLRSGVASGQLDVDVRGCTLYTVKSAAAS